MPDVVGELIVAAVVATGEGESFAAFAEGTYFGVSGITAIGSATLLAGAIGLQYALGRPNVPKPEDGSQALKQAIPPRIRGYGTNRLAGYYMLYEAAGPAPAGSYDVIAFHSGRVERVDGFLLNDDPVTPNVSIPYGGTATILGTYSDERYSHDAIHIDLKIGAAGQSASTLLTGDPLINTIWTSQFVGNDIAYCAMVCNGSSDVGLHSRVYPRGKPELSVIAQCSPCWDPRDPGQDENDETTWVVSFNPVIQLIDYLTRVDGGMGLDRQIILPDDVLALWMVEADLCDDLVAVAGGGTERRYESSGWFRFDNKPEDVIGKILSTCDGWLAEDGEGALTLVVGYYREPTEAPLTTIKGYTLPYGQGEEQMVNQLDITFTDPAQKYVPTQPDPWRDEDLIAATGSVKPQPLDLTWVQSFSQARRLADRAMQRLNATIAGTFISDLDGLRQIGKRWVAVEYPFVSGLQQCVVEIQSASIDYANDRIVWDFIRIAPDTIEAYDPALDEGGVPPVPPPSAESVLLREDGTRYVREDGSYYIRESI